MHFLLYCSRYETGRVQLWSELTALVVANYSPSELTAKITSFGCAFDRSLLPSLEQFSILVDGPHDWFNTEELYQRAMSRIMIAVAQWSKEREEYLALLERARGESDA